MRTPRYTRQFKKDVKLADRRCKDLDKLKEVIASLVGGRSLPAKYKDHPLKGEFIDYRECHIEPDWLLIYKLRPSEIFFVRTGTHSDLFG